MTRLASRAAKSAIRSGSAGLVLGLVAIVLSPSCARTGLLDESNEDAAAVAPSQQAGNVEDATGSVGSPDTAVAEDDGDANLGPATDDATSPAADDASTACTWIGGGGDFGSAECEQSYGESCGSTNYQVDCTCPSGRCVCFGPTTHVIPYSGCPVCPALPPASGIAQVFALCGFPYPH